MPATFTGPGRAIVGASSLLSSIAPTDLHQRTGIHAFEGVDDPLQRCAVVDV
jgi:hypothetical protein